jgi:hypothetical protein
MTLVREKGERGKKKEERRKKRGKVLGVEDYGFFR